MGAAAIVAAAPAYAQQKPAPAASPTPAAAEGPAIDPDDLTAYVRARAADARGAADTAAAGYALALRDVPDDADVARLAYRQAMAAGDFALASKASDVLARAGAAPPDAGILDFAVALHANDGRAIEAALSRLRRGPLDFMVPVLTAWLALDRGADPLAGLEGRSGGALARRYAAEHRALLLIALGRANEGLAALGPLLALDGDERQDLRIDAALLLAGTGKRDAARGLLGGAPGLAPLRDKLGKGTTPSAAFGTARLLLSLAADIAQEDASPLSILLTRCALLLDPEDDRARLFLAEALSRSGADRLALDVLAQVKPTSPYARGAEAGRIAALRRAGQMDEAIAKAKVFARDRGATAADLQSYGDLLSGAGQFAAAADAYAGAIRRDGGDGGWQLNLLRGTALDRAGRWREALPVLRRAVELAPDRVEPLSYLGAAQVEHRENLPEAQALLERAKKLRPNDSAIADSLAWAYYLGGDTAKALPLLEAAAKSDPGGSQVNEHLGDVYWQLGRRYEARYAWRAAAIYADAGAATRIAGKLEGGPTGAN
ncbi:tetratricopeptide repeat protein [Sphingomonas sp.]|uniref:tetratricopeptide repeat protein n=1 Tax=Sphingomonas sp. TaxID=28214 RepID=UPI001B1444B3|nr:tetratricopeptide repeat protein [Sphingomonas sp.]MBO9711788.1 tetratricopeptide repeat protein [Sphingomonas sp.]